MKTKIVSLFLAFGLSINVASASSAGLGYTSDYFYRGAQQSEEAVQASLQLTHGLAGLEGSLGVFTNQSVDSAADTYIVSGGVSKGFMDDLLNAYVGLNHIEDVPGAAMSEVQVSASVGVLLNPTVSAYRDLDDSLYTFELSVSHQFELGFADLDLSALAGNTELTSTDSRDYYSAGAGLSKGLGESTDLSLSALYVDSEDIDREFVFGSSLTFKF